VRQSSRSVKHLVRSDHAVPRCLGVSKQIHLEL
jgi:hypothetical protein